MENTPTAPTNSPTVKQSAPRPGSETKKPETLLEHISSFGAGRFSLIMVSLFRFLVERLEIDMPVAAAIARHAARDLGAVMPKEQVSASAFTVSKASKDNKVTVSEAVKETVKKQTGTTPLHLIHAMAWFESCTKHGFSLHMKPVLNEALRDGLDKLVDDYS